MVKKEAVKTEGKKIGVVSNYFEHVGVIAINLEATLKVGDTIKIVGGEIEEECPVESMQINNKPVKEAKKGDDVGIKVNVKARKGYRVFKI
jgi:putative protease